MKRPRILVVGSMVMDLTFRSERFVCAGETILGVDFSAASGGKGANQAVQAAKLGAEVTMIGKVGKDEYGAQLLEALDRAGVDTSHVTVSEACTTGLSNIQVQCGAQGTQNRIIVIQGANMAITKEEIAFLDEAVAGYDMVVLQQEISMEINEQVARYAYAKGVPVLLNPAPSGTLSAELLSRITYIVPNEQEAKDMTGILPCSEETVRSAANALRARGAKNVLITLGENGAAFWDGNRFVHSPSVHCDHPVDPTAAGDSFIGAFSVAVCAGLDIPDAMAFANHVASVTVSRMGAQPSLPALDEIRGRIKGKVPVFDEEEWER